MNIQLIQGQFNAKDATDIVTQMGHIIIKFHENKITGNSIEEDVEFSETKIKRLQKELFDIGKHIDAKGDKIAIQSTIEIQ